GDHRKLFFNFAAQLMNLLTHAAIDFPEFPLHDPEGGVVSAVQLLRLARKTLANAGVGVVLITLPAIQYRPAHAIKAGTIALKIAPESPIEEALRIVARDGCMPEVELELAMNVGGVHVRQQASLLTHFLIKRRTRNRRVEHELVKIGLVRNRCFNFLDDVVGRMVLQSDDG